MYADYTFYVFCAAISFSSLMEAKGLKFRRRVLYQCISNIFKNETIWSTQIELMDRAVPSSPIFAVTPLSSSTRSDFFSNLVKTIKMIFFGKLCTSLKEEDSKNHLESARFGERRTRSFPKSSSTSFHQLSSGRSLLK
jgi:hypothetical protein